MECTIDTLFMKPTIKGNMKHTWDFSVKHTITHFGSSLWHDHTDSTMESTIDTLYMIHTIKSNMKHTVT